MNRDIQKAQSDDVTLRVVGAFMLLIGVCVLGYESFEWMGERMLHAPALLVGSTISGSGAWFIFAGGPKDPVTSRPRRSWPVGLVTSVAFAVGGTFVLIGQLR